MQQLEFLQKISERIVVGMGFFDSVHAGHRVLLSRVREIASETGAKSAVITFSNNPYVLFGKSSQLIYTFGERLSLFDKLGLDYVIPFEFDEKFRNESKENFLNVLFNKTNITGIVCGYDYKFGQGGSGNAEYLKSVCAEKKIRLEVIEPIMLDGERVSSTLIKRILSAGNIRKANKLLIEPYFMKGTVIHGRGVGKLFGIPTANLQVPADKMLVGSGVYATKTFYDGKEKKSVTNVGTKPTFGESGISVETFIKNATDDLYGKEIKIEFVDFIRGIQQFASPEELADRVRKDIEY